MSASQDDRPDFVELFDRHYEQIRRYALLRIGEESAADDVAARVFERALDRLGGFDPRRGSAAGWLFGIARGAHGLPVLPGRLEADPAAVARVEETPTGQRLLWDVGRDRFVLESRRITIDDIIVRR